jgi:chromosome segregation ATPase
MDSPSDRTASLMTPAKLAQVGRAARAPATGADFLNQMAADAGHQHVDRLAQLRPELESQVTAASAAAALPTALGRLARLLPELDFSLLEQRGWWAGVTGKSRNAGAEFAAQFQRLDEAAKALATDVGTLQKSQQPHAAASERTLLEFEVESRALDTIIDQGARWLQDMRAQLQVRTGEAASDPLALQQVRDDAARCEILVLRLKNLRAAVSASQHVHQQARAAAERRAALAQALQKLAAAELREWRSRVGALASAAAEGKAGGLGLDGPQEAHARLQQRLADLAADGEQLRAQEDALRQRLAAMGEQLVRASA